MAQLRTASSIQNVAKIASYVDFIQDLGLTINRQLIHKSWPVTHDEVICVDVNKHTNKVEQFAVFCKIADNPQTKYVVDLGKQWLIVVAH